MMLICEICEHRGNKSPCGACQDWLDWLKAIAEKREGT